MDQALRESRAVCFLIGPAIREPEERLRELAHLDVRSKAVISIVLPGSRLADIPHELQPFQYQDLSGGLTSSNLRALVEAVRHLIRRG